jgi:DNA transposition AAA+ family ATPase
MCDGALDIRVQPKFKEKRHTPDILLIYSLKRNIFVKRGATIAQSVVTVYGLSGAGFGSR